MSENNQSFASGIFDAGFIEVFDPLSHEYVLTYSPVVYLQPSSDDEMDTDIQPASVQTAVHGDYIAADNGSNNEDMKTFNDTLSAVMDAADDVALSQDAPENMASLFHSAENEGVVQNAEQSSLWKEPDDVQGEGFLEEADYTDGKPLRQGNNPHPPQGNNPHPPHNNNPNPRPPQGGSPNPRPPQGGNPRPPHGGWYVPHAPEGGANMPPPVIIRPPNNNHAIMLSADIYRQLKQIEEDYNTLIQMAYNPHIETLRMLHTQMNVLKLTALNIYFTLSRTALPPLMLNENTLPRNYCRALRAVVIKLADVDSDILQLRRMVNISDINRQLMIMSATVQNHIARLNRLLMDCVL